MLRFLAQLRGCRLGIIHLAPAVKYKIILASVHPKLPVVSKLVVHFTTKAKHTRGIRLELLNSFHL